MQHNNNNNDNNNNITIQESTEDFASYNPSTPNVDDLFVYNQNELLNYSYELDILLNSEFQPEVYPPYSPQAEVGFQNDLSDLPKESLFEGELQNNPSELPNNHLPETENQPDGSSTFTQPEINFQTAEIQLEPIHYKHAIEYVRIFKDEKEMTLSDIHKIILNPNQPKPVAASNSLLNKFYNHDVLTHYLRREWHIFPQEIIGLSPQEAEKKFFHYNKKKCDYYDYLRDLYNLPLSRMHRLLIVAKSDLLDSVVKRIWEMHTKGEFKNTFLSNWYTNLDELCGLSEKEAQDTISFYDLSLNQIKNIYENICKYSLKDIKERFKDHPKKALSEHFHFKNEAQFDLYLKKRWDLNYDQLKDLVISNKDKRLSPYYFDSKFNIALRPICNKPQVVNESLDNASENNSTTHQVSSDAYVQSVLATLQGPTNGQSLPGNHMNKKQRVDNVAVEYPSSIPLRPSSQSSRRTQSRSTVSSNLSFLNSLVSSRIHLNDYSINSNNNNINTNNNDNASNVSVTSQKSTDPLGIEALVQSVLQNAKQQP